MTLVTLPRGKRALHDHLAAMHGQLYPDTPAGWTHDEISAAHRAGHSPDGVMTVAHHHREDQP